MDKRDIRRNCRVCAFCIRQRSYGDVENMYVQGRAYCARGNPAFTLDTLSIPRECCELSFECVALFDDDFFDIKDYEEAVEYFGEKYGNDK